MSSRERAGARLDRAAGVTLLELVTVMLIVTIIGLMLLPVVNTIENRVARVKCVSNLKSLHVGANLYVQEHRSWPQIKTQSRPQQDIATEWIARLQPYGIQQINWVCPTIQKLLGAPDLTDPNNVRIDYTSTPFDPNPQTPYRWTNQPWFVENGDMHGNGNLIIFADGHVQELNDFRKASPTPGH
jgi:competence protein ComGC